MASSCGIGSGATIKTATNNVATAVTPSRDIHDVRHCENARHTRIGLPRCQSEATMPMVVSTAPSSSAKNQPMGSKS